MQSLTVCFNLWIVWASEYFFFSFPNFFILIYLCSYYCLSVSIILTYVTFPAPGQEFLNFSFSLDSLGSPAQCSPLLNSACLRYSHIWKKLIKSLGEMQQMVCAVLFFIILIWGLLLRFSWLDLWGFFFFYHGNL